MATGKATKPVKNRVDQCIAVTTYNFKKTSSVYMSDIYTSNSSLVVRTRRFVDSFIESIYMKEIFKKSISYMGWEIRNDLDKNIKTFTSSNSFNHTLKNSYWKTGFFKHYCDFMVIIPKIIFTIKTINTIFSIIDLFIYPFIYLIIFFSVPKRRT